MKRKLLFTMATVFALTACETKDMLIQPMDEKVDLKLELPVSRMENGGYVLHYRTADGKVSGGTVQWNGYDVISLPLTGDQVARSKFVITEAGQTSYILSDLKNITIDYTHNRAGFIGRVTPLQIFKMLDVGLPATVQPIVAKIRLMTSEDDFEAAQCSGLDINTLSSEILMENDSGPAVIPNNITIGQVVNNADGKGIVLYENDFIVEKKELRNFQLRMFDTDGWELFFYLDNVPLEPGKTLSLGGLSLTSEVKLKITIDPTFDDSYN